MSKDNTVNSGIRNKTFEKGRLKWWQKSEEGAIYTALWHSISSKWRRKMGKLY